MAHWPLRRCTHLPEPLGRRPVWVGMVPGASPEAGQPVDVKSARSAGRLLLVCLHGVPAFPDDATFVRRDG